MTPSFLANQIVSDPLVLFLSGLSLLILFIWYFATESDRRKRNVGSVLVLGLCAMCAVALYPPKDTLKGGIDIVGGSAFTLSVQPAIDPDTNQPRPVRDEDLDNVILTIEKRLNSMGTSDMLIAKSGTDRVIVQMPGMTPETADDVRKRLQQVAKLEFKEVNIIDPTLVEKMYNGEEPTVPGFKAYKHDYDRDGEPYTEYLLLSRRTQVSGADVANAQPSFDPDSNEPLVNITLSSEGGEKMKRLTENMRINYDRMAVLLDGEVITAPSLKVAPLGKRFVITGQESFEESATLASQLRNPLENELKIEEERTISPSLGASVVKQGATAGIVGLAFTAIFIFIYYRTAGIVALFALAVNALIIFGTMAMFEFTFTLPGIAGIILTIGMAVDANVLIYERLREELANGKSLATSINAAYEKAFSAIFDANITSLITAVILFWKASGTVAGFAVTLTIGLLGSMFSAILVTRVMYRWGMDLKILKNVSMLNVFKSTNWDFLGKRKIAFTFSIVLFIAAISGFAVKQDRALGVDFTGGTLLSFQFAEGSEGIRQADAQEALKDLDTSAVPVVQEENVPGSGELLSIRCATEDATMIEETLREHEGFDVLRKRETVTVDGKETTQYVVQSTTETVSATAGKSFLINSAIAIGLGLVAIMIYISIRFEFSFALGATVAVLHDVIIATGLVVLFGGELSLIHVGAILTIAGYSINDTIIVFDRIRESLLTSTGTVKDLMNQAINATLSRTLLTSMTTIFSVTILAIFGGAGLRDFSVMILVGLFVGTYSSIFVASPIVLIASGGKGKNLRREVIDSTLAGETAANA